MTGNNLTLFDRDVFEVFVHPGEVVEVRAFGVNGRARSIMSGYYDDHELFCKELKRLDKQRHSGIYFTIQVIDPRLIARAFNRMISAGLTTSDNNVIAYRWLLLDFDPIRPAGIGSSDSELQAALSLRDEVADAIVSEYGLTRPISAMSGNGGHLLVPLPDMPTNDKTKLFIVGILTDLSKRFSNDIVKIDTAVFNPARIWKLYGTTARKGDAVPAGPRREARPHRMSYIDRII